MLVVLVLSVGRWTGTARLAAEEVGNKTAVIATENSEVQREAMRLIREDAEKKRLAATEAAKLAPAVKEEKSFDQPEEGVVLLEAFDVQGERDMPDFEAPPETTVAKFFRTGTISQHIGKKVTTRFWSSGDAGLVFSVRW